MPSGGLDRLTDRERRILRLLASGHTVKSAASEEGTTENAANELLRSARRKLGTGSSREAARLLAQHEGTPRKTRDEKSVIPVSRADERSSFRFNRGIVAMIVTALAASAAVILALQGGSSAGPPKVVATVPADGAVIEPGPFRLSVIFDRPMAPDSYAFAHDAAEAPFPECTGKPRLSPDRRTYTLDCMANPGERYVVYFNRQPHIGFVDAETRSPAQQARLEFTTRAVASEAVASAPRVMRTVPADGAEIAPGSFTVEITFDRPMLPQAYSLVRTDEGLYPECPSPPRLSADGRTYSVECVARRPGKYVMYFNRPPYMNFRDARTQVSGEPARLEFTVGGN